MNHLVSDLHLNHNNIIGHCDRPVSSVEEMNGMLVEHWNTVVEPDD
jgi:calcineurin-like phosphoesterase family protein